MVSASYPSSAFQLQETQVAAQALGVQLQVVEIRSPDEFENAFAAMTEAGCLIAYAPDILAMFRRAAVFVDKSLKGTTPADLPVELPHKLELFLNAKTAEVLGLTFPPTLLRLADEVIK